MGSSNSMALTKDQKTAQIQDLTDKFQSASSVMFANYIGLSVLDVSELRSKLRESESEMKVAKKTLIKIAAEKAGMPEIADENMEGAISLIFSFGDPLSGAQIAFKFSKQHDQVALVGGIYDGKILTKEEALELAKMPGRKELLAIFASMLNSPLTSFANMCGSPLGGFARALQQMADKGKEGKEDTVEKEKEEDAPEESESPPKASTEDTSNEAS